MEPYYKTAPLLPPLSHYFVLIYVEISQAYDWFTAHLHSLVLADNRFSIIQEFSYFMILNISLVGKAGWPSGLSDLIISTYAEGSWFEPTAGLI